MVMFLAETMASSPTYALTASLASKVGTVLEELVCAPALLSRSELALPRSSLPEPFVAAPLPNSFSAALLLSVADFEVKSPLT